MTKAEIIDILETLNQDAKLQTLHIYAGYFEAYQEARKNIDNYGIIAEHPKTGAPLENPYFKVLQQSAEKMERMSVEASILWERE